MTLSTLWASRSAATEPSQALPNAAATDRRLPNPGTPPIWRKVLFGALAVASVSALALIPVACQSGGVGDPCTPEDEYNTQFAGFNVAQENIESRSFQCATRICLVNHFQGRVSCPQGQAQPHGCDPKNNGADCAGKSCVASQVFAPTCNDCTGSNDPNCVPLPCPAGAGGSQLQCDMQRQICTCSTSDAGNIEGVTFVCEPADNSQGAPQVLRAYVCHAPGQCQTIADGITTNNQVAGVPKDCCVPGTDSPVAVQVCGQCNATSKRDAQNAVYCSCRCCVPCCDSSVKDQMTADSQGCSLDVSICGPACDPNFNYCTCPSGFTCTGIRTNVGLGDNQLAGAYCIKQGSAYIGDLGANCGKVVGFGADMSCKGTPTAAPPPDGGT
jgi:hypothetical protein